jgi:hypothetical protein
MQRMVSVWPATAALQAGGEMGDAATRRGGCCLKQASLLP